MKLKIIFFLTCLSLLFSFPSLAFNKQVVLAYKKNIVKIEIVNSKTYEKIASGTGFYISKNQLLTNYHVIGNVLDKPDRYVAFDSNNKKALKVIKFDLLNDLALLESPQESENPIKLSNDEIQFGDNVYSMGYPLGEDFSINQGIANNNISSDGRDLIFLSVSINPGMSGGPVINDDGNLVGMNDLGNLFAQQMSYFVPLSKIKEFLKSPATTINYPEDSRNKIIEINKSILDTQLTDFVDFKFSKLNCGGDEIEKNSSISFLNNFYSIYQKKCQSRFSTYFLLKGDEYEINQIKMQIFKSKYVNAINKKRILELTGFATDLDCVKTTNEQFYNVKKEKVFFSTCDKYLSDDSQVYHTVTFYILKQGIDNVSLINNEQKKPINEPVLYGIALNISGVEETNVKPLIAEVKKRLTQ